MFSSFQKLPSLMASALSYLDSWCTIYVFFFFSDIYLIFFPQQSDDIRPFMYLIIIVT